MQKNETKSIGRLISIIHRQSRVYFHRHLEPYGLGHGQIPILMYIIHHEGTTQHDISRHFQMDKGSTSSLIKNLEKNDFIQKEQNTNDKRCYGLYITDKTRNLLPEFKKIFQGLTEILIEGFTETEKEKSFEILNRMIANIEKSNGMKGGHQ